MSILTGVLPAASNVPVRYKEGLTHGFLVLSTLDGKQIAVGDLTEVARGNKVTTRLVFHFSDGSLQDETTVFSQRQNLHLITYHLVQKGPAFPHPTEVSIVTSTGQVTVQYGGSNNFETNLQSAGFTNVKNLTGGMMTWQDRIHS